MQTPLHLHFFDSMKKMQKEMKDVELQLGIVANQVCAPEFNT
jgi:hypothetical protein